MKNNQLSLFELFSLSWITMAILALVFAILGIFYLPLVAISLLLIILFDLYLIRKRHILLQISPKSTFIVATLLLLFLALSWSTTPTIFGGRDEGSYSNAALLLTQNHSLDHQDQLTKQFFSIYGPGKALNFPGFYYDNHGTLKSQFLPGYISWIAVWYDLFGLNGIKFVNLFPLLTFLLSFYLVIRKTFALIGDKFQSFDWLGLAFLVSCFPLIVFYKFTLSEIFFAALAWFCLYLLLRYFENKTYSNYLLIFLPLIPMLFTRIETAALIFMLFFILALKDFNHLRKPNYQFIFFILGIILFLALFINANFFVEQLKNLAQPFLKKELSPAMPNNLAPSDDLMNFYLIKVFFNYNILPFLVMGTMAIISIIRSKKYRLLLPLIFFLPTLIFLVDANISLDHPWMLRRFLFSIIPVFIIYSCIFLDQLAKRDSWLFPGKILVRVIIITALATNLVLLLPNFSSNNFLSFSQNKGLLGQTANLPINFSPVDLILVSQKSSGNGWSLLSEPLRNLQGLQAVYFFNPHDLEKINKNKFANIYLLTSTEEENLYADLDKEKITSYQINNQIIFPSKDPLAKPQFAPLEVKGSVYRLK